mgnify:CR=1 FL=1
MFNAANEAAVNLFLNKKINYLDIQRIILNTLETFNHLTDLSIETIIELDNDIKQHITHDASL